MKNITVESERLKIQSRSVEQMETLQRNEKDPELKQAYAEMIAAMKPIPNREEWACDWAIERKDGETVGGIGFKGVPDETGSVEIGYGIDEPHRRRGYATEAVGAMTAWAFKQPGVVRVTAQTEPGNETSQKVLMKNGFVPCGTGSEGPLFEVKKQHGGPAHQYTSDYRR